MEGKIAESEQLELEIRRCCFAPTSLAIIEKEKSLRFPSNCAGAVCVLCAEFSSKGWKALHASAYKAGQIKSPGTISKCIDCWPRGRSNKPSGWITANTKFARCLYLEMQLRFAPREMRLNKSSFFSANVDRTPDILARKHCSISLIYSRKGDKEFCKFR